MQPSADSSTTPAASSPGPIPSSTAANDSHFNLAAPNGGETNIGYLNGGLSGDFDETSLGMADHMAQLHGLEERQVPLQRKHRRLEEGDDDPGQKKAKTVHGGFSGGGALGEYLKDESKKQNADGGATAIDLTGDDDDDVVITNETFKPKRDPGNEEVCIGVLPCQGNIDRVPSAGTYLGKDVWPVMRITFKRSGNNRDQVIEMMDKQGKSFGRLSVVHASALTPLMLGAHISGFRLKAYLPQRPRKQSEPAGASVSQRVDVEVYMYCKRKVTSSIGKFLSQKQLFLQSPKRDVDSGKAIENPHVPQIYRDQKIGTGASRPSYGSQTIAYTTRTAEEMQRDATQLFDDLAKNENLPEMEADRAIIQTELLPHQKQGLRFLVNHEHHDETTQEDGEDKEITSKFSLWKHTVKVNGKEVWYNVITGQEVREKPEAARGGILADMMGLGKTLSILALIAATVKQANDFAASEPDAEGIERNAKSTLIICPTSVLANWTEQTQSHIIPGKLSVYVYHGNTRTQDLEELSSYDIVLTTYGTIGAEFGSSPKVKKAAGLINWFRIVLDEAHTIRTANTRVSKGACALYAHSRWAVTGTPVQNRLDDLGSLIRFLRIKPFDEASNWAQYILAPFKNANSDVVQHLRLLVDGITLRRGKENIGLTNRVERNAFLEFTDEERQLYGAFASRSNMQLKGMTREGNTLKRTAYMHVLNSLLRLRMICDHGREMLAEDDLKELDGMDASNAIDLGDEPELETKGKFISDRQAYEVLKVQSESAMDYCASCSNLVVGKQIQQNVDDSSSEEEDEDEDDVFGYITPCFHIYCPDCKDKLDESTTDLRVDGYHHCPVCDSYVKYDFFALSRRIFQAYLDGNAPGAKKNKRAAWDATNYSGPHTKVLALLTELEKSREETAALPEGEPPIRSVVFSDWTSYLDLVQFALENHGHNIARLDGTMTVKKRRDALHTFKTDPNVTVLLISIRAGGQGLNLTSGNKVYVMEPQYNPAVEQQAVDRVHRLGQERDVEITHFIMKDTVEEAMLKLQEKKKKLAKLSMDRKVRREVEKNHIEELRELFK